MRVLPFWQINYALRVGVTLGGYMALAKHHFTIFADYFQFVLMDEQSTDDFSEIWSDEALHRMLAVGSMAVCPGTLRNIEVNVQVQVTEAEPNVDSSGYDHAAKASIEIPSGRLVVMSCSGHLPDAPRIDIKSGTYQVLFLVSGVESITDESAPADDVYTVFLWPGVKRDPELIRHWQQTAA